MGLLPYIRGVHRCKRTRTVTDTKLIVLILLGILVSAGIGWHLGSQPHAVADTLPYISHRGMLGFLRR